MRPILLPCATNATLMMLLAATLTGSERLNDSSTGDPSSIQTAASDSEIPASCHFDEMNGRGRSRLKLMDGTAYELAREGCRGSATFRGLVQRIEELRGFVYVTSKVTLPATTEGVLQHRIQLTPDGSRCLWIVVKRDRRSILRVGVLGHELQHAVEVLENLDVRNSDDLERLFRRQRRADDGQILETDAALAAGDRVVSELSKRLRRHITRDTFVEVPAQPTPELAPHIRVEDPAIASLVEQGKTLSPTFSHIVKSLERSMVVVYVHRGRCRYSRVRACVLHKVVVGGQARVLWMRVEPSGLGPAEAIALLAHELRHVQELAEAEWVRSDDDVRRFFRTAPGALGTGDGERTHWETPAAIDAQLRVERELRSALALKRPG